MEEIIRIKAYLQTVTALVSFDVDESKKQTLTTIIGFVNNEISNLEQTISEQLHTKEIQPIEKPSKKKASSGFIKPTLISDELATFLGKEKGTLLSRTEVSKEIHKYISNNNLQDQLNRRIINPNANLKSLLKLKNGEQLTYFNIQRYLKCHFIKGIVKSG